MSAAIAQEIIRQMGGAGRIAMFTGAKRFLAHNNGVSFRFPNRSVGRPNFVKITLNGRDLYDVEFIRIYGEKITPIEEKTNLYSDMLVRAFEDATGLFLSF